MALKTNEVTGYSLTWKWLGIKRSARSSTKKEVADMLSAKEISLGDNIINVKNPYYRDLATHKRSMNDGFRNLSLPWVEKGIRLVRNEHVAELKDWYQEEREILEQFIQSFADHWNDIINEARTIRGNLFSDWHYPYNVKSAFGSELKPREVMPPEHLKLLDPEEYEKQRQAALANFKKAEQLHEQLAMEQFKALLENLQDKLAPAEPGGKKKVLRDAAVTNLQNFFQNFRKLQISCSEQLQEVLDQAEGFLEDATGEKLRNNHNYKKEIAQQVNNVVDVLSDRFVSMKVKRKVLMD